MKGKLMQLVRGKRVQVCGHWDADGIASAALLYHLIKPHCSSITTMTKGKPFLIEPEDIKTETEVVVCADIAASTDILKLPQKPKVVYIDHHPNEDVEKFDLSIHDPEMQSATLLIYNTLLSDTKNPYFIFLVLMGYFGDGGDREYIPAELHVNANSVMPEMMRRRDSMYSGGYYLEIERYVPALNTGKRLHWSGDVPLELLKSIECYKPFVNNFHPLAQQLQEYRLMLRKAYEQDLELKSAGNIDYVIIEDPRNIQGVIAARHSKGRPIMVMNIFGDEVIGSMRVPDDFEFDAGAFLDKFNGKLESFLGGGHEKAAGFTFQKDKLDSFLEMVRNFKF